jgi:DNA repair protein RadC
VGTRRYTIKELPPELRPRERLLSEGAEALSSAELLGILFGTGSKETTAIELAGQVPWLLLFFMSLFTKCVEGKFLDG